MKYLLIFLIFSGCMTPKKAVDVLNRPKNEPEAAEFCANKYPVQDTYIKGDSVIRYDTLWGLVTDTLISEPQVIVYTDTVRVPKLVTKTIVRTDTVYRENTAKVSVLNSQIANVEAINRQQAANIAEISQQRDGYKSEKNKWKFRFFLLLAIVGFGYAAKVKLTKRFF